MPSLTALAPAAPGAVDEGVLLQAETATSAALAIHSVLVLRGAMPRQRSMST